MDVEQGMLLFFINEVSLSITGILTVCWVPFVIFSKHLLSESESMIPSAKGPLIFCTTYIIVIVTSVIFMTSVVFNEIILNATNYMLICNVYWVNIIFNVVARRTFSDSPLSIFINGLFLTMYPMTKLGPHLWYDGFNFNFVFLMTITLFLQVSVLTMQLRFGSRSI